MGANRGGEVDERVELLHLARAGDRQQSGDGDLAVGAARAKHDLPPLNGGPERAFGGVVRRLDSLLVHEGEEVRQVQEQRACEIPHIIVDRVDVPAGQREELLLDRQHLRDQVLACERRAADERIAPEAMPQTEQPFLQRERLAAKAQGRGRLRQFLLPLM